MLYGLNWKIGKLENWKILLSPDFDREAELVTGYWLPATEKRVSIFCGSKASCKVDLK
jgi:hypothetical protein